jgi:hypothetical protein
MLKAKKEKGKSKLAKMLYRSGKAFRRKMRRSLTRNKKVPF